MVGFHFKSARIRDGELTAGGFSTVDFEFVALIPGVGVNLVILIAGDVQDDGLTTLDVDLLSVRVDLAVLIVMSMVTASAASDGLGLCDAGLLALAEALELGEDGLSAVEAGAGVAG